MSHPPRILVPYRLEAKVQPYAQAMRAVGAEPVLFETTGPGSLDGVDGLLLTGGTDVHPQRYGQSPAPETDEPDSERDAIEFELLDKALQLDMPILAICRGVQLLNVHHGGTLVQHLGSEVHTPVVTDRSLPAHTTTIQSGTLLADVMEVAEAEINSRHHQAIADLGVALQVCSTAPHDGVIEALERRDKTFVLGVQWHPEDQIRQPEQLRLFSRFAQACARRSEGQG